MRPTLSSLVIAVGVALAATARAQTPDPAQYGDPKVVAAATAAAEAGGTGPLKATMRVEPSLPTHTVYRPKALPAGKLPVIVWGNGACVNYGNRFRYLLTEIASYGYVAIANGPIGPSYLEGGPALTAPGAPPPPPAAPGSTPPATRSQQLIDAMDWAAKENARKGGPYFGKLDLTKIAVMGQSCGGVQAIEASADPRTTTTVVWNSGLFPTPTTMAGGKTLTREDLKALHAPVAYISGDSQDVAFPNANGDFEAIDHLPVFRAYEKGVGHIGTYREPSGGDFAKVAVAWLDWRLKGRKAAEKWFVGKDCGLCTDPKWVVAKKKIP